MRGRLINRFSLQIYRFDPIGTADDPGFDRTFREPKLIATEDGKGTVGRRELDPILVPAQFSSNSSFLTLAMSGSGNLGESSFKAVFHFRDLEDMGLVEASTGLAQIKVRDRLGGVYDSKTGALIQAIPNPPGMFAQSASPKFGLGNSRNLLEVMFVSRDPGMPVDSQFGRTRPSVW